jgi:prophage antirepressor-like protein
MNPINNADVLHTFYFEGQKIRIAMKDGKPFFVLDNVCKALGTNPNELDEKELKTAKINLNDLKCNLIDFNSAKINNRGHNGK